ncbi:MAG: ABC transporter substrate-binding protein [Candidatus Acidiferrales bacterium]
MNGEFMTRSALGKPRAVVTTALATAILLLAASCGNTSPGSGQSLPKTITIGILTPLTGDLGAYGKVWENTFELARDQINASGLLPDGATIQTVVEDDKGDPQTGIQAAQKMIQVEHVSVIVGPDSAVMVALVPIAHRDKIPVLSPGAGTITLNKLGGQYLYRTVASDNSDGLAAAKFVVDQGGKNVAVLFENAESPASVGTTFGDALKRLGQTVSTQVALNPGQTSYQAEVAKALATNPEWIFCACGQQTTPTVIREADAAGYKGKWMFAADSVTQDVITAAGAGTMNGAYGELASSDTSLPAYQAFADAYTAKYGKSAADQDLMDLASNAYDDMILVALAIVQSHSATGEAINSALREVANPPGTKVSTFADGVKEIAAGHKINYEGASGPCDFDSSGTTTSPYEIDQVQSGSWKQVKFYPASAFVGAAGGG